jgi:hypothetical protein
MFLYYNWDPETISQSRGIVSILYTGIKIIFSSIIAKFSISRNDDDTNNHHHNRRKRNKGKDKDKDTTLEEEVLNYKMEDVDPITLSPPYSPEASTASENKYGKYFIEMEDKAFQVYDTLDTLEDSTLSYINPFLLKKK